MYNIYIENKWRYLNLTVSGGGSKKNKSRKIKRETKNNNDNTNLESKEFRENFYLVHSTFSHASLLDILNDGFLRPSVQLKKQTYISGEKLNYIYANINFDDINNIDTVGGYKLFLSPELFFDEGFVFNKGWFKYPVSSSIHVNKNETRYEKIKKLKIIKKYLKNPSFQPKHLIKNAGYRAHEILFDKEIDLEKYLIGVECDDCEIDLLDDLLRERYPIARLFKGIKNKKGLIEPPQLSYFMSQ